jgi:thiosulfate dehydrogenase
MAKSNRSTGRSSGARRGGGGGAGRLLLGILLGVLFSAAGIAAYFYFGHPPVSVTDRASLWEPLVTSAPMHSRARAESKTPPFSASEDVFEAAAHTYRAQCAQCHGTPGHDAPVGHTMQPRAQQFFAAGDRKSIAAQAPGQIYWETAFGVRHSGMPAFNHTLSDTQLWQLSLLLHAAGDELPDPVHNILAAGVPPPQPTEVKP